MMIGNIIDDKEVQDAVGYEKYDIVAANILADVLVPLTPVIVNQMKKAAFILLQVSLIKRRNCGKNCKRCRIGSIEVTYQGEWVSVTARKN